VLRVSIGFHFFYEGVWKITNPDKFSAQPFLEMSKGPLKPVFDMMIADKDGSERLAVQVKASAQPLIKKWRGVYDTGLESLRNFFLDKEKKEKKTVAAATIQHAVRILNRDALPALWKAEDQLNAVVAKAEKDLLVVLDSKPAAELAEAKVELAGLDKEDEKYESQKADIEAKITKLEETLAELKTKRDKLAAELGIAIEKIDAEFVAAINKMHAEATNTIKRATTPMVAKLSVALTVTETTEDGKTSKTDAQLIPGVKTGLDYHYIDSLGTVINKRSESESLGLPIYDAEGKSVESVGGKLTGADGQTLVVTGHVCPGLIHQDMIDRIQADAYSKFQVGAASMHENETAAANQMIKAEQWTRRYKDEIDGYLGDSMVDILRYFGSMDRLAKAVKKGDNGAAHQQKRDWDEQGALYREVKGWLKALDGAVENYSSTFYTEVLNDAQREMGAMHKDFTWNDFLTLMLTFSLTAIGFCLIIGAFTRPAALGGAAFMCFVVASQPNWPSLYPPSPAVTGHALLINKDFIELIALLLVAAAGAGRWGGIDKFIEPFCMKYVPYFPRKCRPLCERVLGWFGLWCEEEK